MLKRFAGAIICALVVLGAGVASAPAAQAAPCWGATCAGQNPMIGCNVDAAPLVFRDYKAENNASFRLEVRYSRACNAAWGRLTVWSGSNVGFALSSWNPNGASRGAIGHEGNVTWTSMIDGTPQDCAGSQFYINGNWVRWYFVGCV